MSTNSLKPIVNVAGNKLTLENLTLLQKPLKTFLTVNTASGVNTLTVKNIIGFAVNQIIIIGELGNEGTELVKTDSSIAPSGSTITLLTNTIFPHSSGTPIYIIDADQVEFSNAATLTGSKSVLVTKNISVDSLYTIYSDTAGSTGYYFARFKNTITGFFSVYSDGIPVGGYEILTARQIIDSALEDIGKKTSSVLNDNFAFRKINECQIEVLREMKRWSFMQVFDFGLGQITTGQWRVAIPTNLDDQFTNRSIYNFRIGTTPDLRWVDKEKWDEIIQGVSHTTLAVAIAVNDPTITLTDASDFPDSGSLYIGANIYQYSSINRTTNVVTLSSLSTTTNLINSDVFLGASFGMPQYWTIFGGYLYFYPVLGSTYNQRSGHLDYYKILTRIVNDSDLIVLPDPTIVQYYLEWKFLLKLNNGNETDGSKAQYDNYVARRDNLKRKEVLGRTFQLKPVLNQINVNSNIDDRQQRTGNFNTGN